MPEADLLRVSAGPGSLHVERYGLGGHPIVLLHGFGTSSFLWRAVGPLLAEAGHTAYAVDLLGYGESDRPFDADYSVAAQAEHLERAMGGLRLQRATVVGVDIGGGVALRLAAEHPMRVTSLVLVNSVAFDDWPGEDIKMLNRTTATRAFRVSRGMLGAAALLGPLLEGSVATAARMPMRLVARYLAPYVGEEGVTHLLTLARALNADDLTDVDMADVRAPALIVWGEEDHWLDPGLPARLHQALPGSTLARLPDVARLVPEEAPERLAGIIHEFVAANAAAARTERTTEGAV